MKWYRKAAEQNYAQAQSNLGVCYANGVSGTRDWVEAEKWYRKAAEQNNAMGQINLAGCYIQGRGVTEDLVEAYKWLLLAARQGDEDAKKHATWLEGNLRPEQNAAGKTRARDFKPR